MNVHDQQPELVSSMKEIGRIVRRERRRQRVTQADAAGLCGVSVHFFSNLERGKETSEFSKVIQVLTAMNIRVYLVTPGDAP